MRLFRTAAMAALAALLAGCQFNFITRIGPTGAGSLTTEVGLSADEAAQLSSFAGEEGAGPCAGMTSQVQDGGDASAFVEEMRGTETWCVSTQAFDDGSQLETLYRRLEGVTIHELAEREGIFVYDIDVDLQAPQGAPAVPAITWTVELPGKLGDHNADRVNGQRLEWTLRPGESRRLTASSDLYPLPLPGALGSFPPWLLIAGAVAVCLGLPGVLLLAGLIVFLRRGRRRAQEAA